MHHPSPREPDRDKEGEELGQSDGGGGLEDVEVLEDVRDTHEPHGSQEPQAYPGAVKVDGDKGGGNGEVVHKGVEFQHEPKLVRGSNELHKRQI